MHIYIQLMAEGYQRSFPAIWGWHWYRSYLMPKERRLEPQIVTWDPSFCRGFGLCFCAGTRWGFVLLVLGAQRFLSCLHPLQLLWTSLLPERRGLRVWLPGNFGVSFGVKDYWDLCSHCKHQGTACAICMGSPSDAQKSSSIWKAYKLLLPIRE